MIEAQFRERLRALELVPGTGLVAVSGGADSTALLTLLAEQRDAHPLRLVVGHVDHGIHPASADVALQVESLARRWGLRFESTRLALGPRATETAARRARWAWLFATLDRVGPGVILTAHHREDQVETVLMRVLAGSGPAGLTGMAPHSSRVIRPLLGFKREQLRSLVHSRALPTWEDPANQDTRHLRAWLRTRVVPLLRERFPDLDARVLAVARQAEIDRSAWAALLDVLPLEPKAERGGISVASGPLRVYDLTLALSLIMAVARRTGLALGPDRARRVLEAIRSSQSGARIELGGGWLAELRFDRVAVVKGRTEAVGGGPGRPVPDRVVIDTASGRGEIGEWGIEWRLEAGPGVLDREGWVTWLVPGVYEVRPWRPGDRIRPLGGRGSRPVARCLQERKVGRDDRPGWPVVVSGEAVIWVPGVCRGRENVPVPGMEAWRLDVDRG